MKQKLIILLILSTIFIGSINAEVPPAPTGLVSDTSDSGHVLWSWFADTGNVTNSYNVSVDSIWYNSTTSTSYDDNVGTGATSTIIVWAFNNTDAGNLSATSITGSEQGVLRFNSITDTIEAIIPIFTSLKDLVIAIVPYILTLALIGGLIVLVKGLFNKGLKFR